MTLNYRCDLGLDLDNNTNVGVDGDTTVCFFPADLRKGLCDFFVSHLRKVSRSVCCFRI